MVKLSAQVGLKSAGDAFYVICTKRPHELSGVSPSIVKSVDLLEGQWGTVGSVIGWKYIHDGKECVVKDIIEAVDEEKKSTTFKVIEGHLLELYKSFKFTIQIDDNMVTWTFNYEKVNENVPEPYSLMDAFLAVTKHIETHHLHPNPAQARAPVLAPI